MKLFLIKRTDQIDWDEYAAAVVVAENEEMARRIYPGEVDGRPGDMATTDWTDESSNISVECIGETGLQFPANRRVILADYRAG